MRSNRFIKLIVTTLVMTVFSASALFAQTTKLSGTVTDDNGQPIIGVTVMVLGTLNGTQTDSQGNWSLSVTDAETSALLFSCLGYSNVEESIGTRSVINITMSENAEQLQETVVIGYGTQKKVNLTGSVASVDFADVAKDRTIVSTSAALAGLVPGMSVMQSSGQPGSDSATIRIRGAGSFNSSSNSPLVLVDGVEYSMDLVNPNDIESISVLKDAASASIYGTRAANGVILITTKNGSEGNARISYSFKGVFQDPYCKLSFVSDYADYMELMNESRQNLGFDNLFSQTNIDLWREKSKDPNGIAESGYPNYMVYPNTDWFDTLFNTGFSQEHNLSVSGGSRNVRYMMSLGYLDNQGIMQHTGADSGIWRINFRGNVEADVTKWFTMGMKIFGNETSYGLASVSSAYEYLPLACPGIYPGSDGKWGDEANPEESTGSGNPLARLYGSGGYDRYTRINGSVYAHIRPYKGISIEGTINYSPTYRDRHSYSRYTQEWHYPTDELATESNLANASATNTTSRNYYLTTEILARYNTKFGKDHDFGALVGYTTTEYYSWGWAASRLGATDWSLNDLGTYESMNSITSTAKSGWALRSYFGRINYALKDRYLFEFDIRADGSSRFGSNNRYGVFPAVSAGWKIHEENFMKSARTWLDELKFRVSWGQAGNCNGIGNYTWQATYSTQNMVTEGDIAKGLYISSLSNADLKWETTNTTDVGVDLAFFQNRLTAEFDYYNKYTYDILSTPSTYYTMGFTSSVAENEGIVSNNGFEWNVNWRGGIGKDFHYYVGVNGSYNVNKCIKYKGALVKEWVDGVYYNNESDVTGSYNGGLFCEGYQLGEYYGRMLYRGTGTGYSGSGAVDVNAGPKDGMIRTQTDFEWVQAMIDSGYSFAGVSALSKDQLWYGDLIYEDSNGDGNYGDSNDMNFHGRTGTPSVLLGINLGFSWKGFDFSMIWSGAFDFYIYWNTAKYNRSDLYYGAAISSTVAADHYFFDPDNPSDSRTNINAKYPRLTYNTALNNSVTSDFYEYKGDYMKLKSVTLGYTLPEKITKKFFVQALKFYVSGENLLTITSFPGQDPELGSTIGYPLMRQYTLGAQITF